MGERGQRGRAAPSSADHSSSPLGVDGSRSSPRMTWVMRHVDVVDHVGQDEQRCADRLHHHEVLDGVVREDDVAPDEVVDHRRSPSSGTRKRSARPVAVQAPVPTEAVVAGGGVALGAGVDLLAGAVAGVDGPRLPQRVDGAVGSASVRSDCRNGPSSGSMPSHASDDTMPSTHSSRLRSVSVSSMRRTKVPAVLAGEEPVEQGGPGAADVEEAGGRRGEADPGPARPPRPRRSADATPGATRPRRA